LVGDLAEGVGQGVDLAAFPSRDGTVQSRLVLQLEDTQ
jgi:hypothetical protein